MSGERSESKGGSLVLCGGGLLLIVAILVASLWMKVDDFGLFPKAWRTKLVLIDELALVFLLPASWELLKRSHELIQQARERRRASRRSGELRRLLTAKPALVKAIRDRYGTSGPLVPLSVELAGKHIPTVMYAGGPLAAAGASFHFDSTPPGTFRARSRDLARRHRRFLEASGRPFTDDLAYRLTRVVPSPGGCAYHFQAARFFEYLHESAGLLEYEAFHERGRWSHRDDVMGDCAALLELDRRICLGGVNLVMAIVLDGKIVIPLQVRSGEVADGRGEVSVIPKGFHQHLADPASDVGIRQSILRELAEEYFDFHEHAQQGSQVLHASVLERCAGMKFVIDELAAEDGCVRCEPTRVCLNGITGNYNFNFVILIDTDRKPEARRHFGVFPRTWESDRIMKVSATDSAGVLHLMSEHPWNDESLIAFADALSWLRGRRGESILDVRVVAGERSHERSEAAAQAG
jgi:hypothetical protein